MKDNNDTLEREDQEYALKYMTADMIANLNYQKHLKELNVQSINIQ